jgi:thiaminase (transcriptional activator TenA)
MSFSSAAWREIAPIYGAIRAMPFISELAAGTLAPDRFRFYIRQDARYLVDFARALALCAIRAPDPGAMSQILARATNALAVEQKLHASFFRQFGLADLRAEAIEPTPTCFGYVNFLLAAAQGAPYPTAIGAVLPCFWIYREIGCEIKNTAAPDNAYRAWIDTYGDPGFGAAVDGMIALADRTAAAASADDRAAMLAAFRRAAQFEWMFWDSAYRLETWPIGPRESSA